MLSPVHVKNRVDESQRDHPRRVYHSAPDHPEAPRQDRGSLQGRQPNPRNQIEAEKGGGKKARTGQGSDRTKAKEAPPHRRGKAGTQTQLHEEVAQGQPESVLRERETVAGEPPGTAPHLQPKLETQPCEANRSDFVSADEWYDYHEAMRLLRRVRGMR